MTIVLAWLALVLLGSGLVFLVLSAKESFDAVPHDVWDRAGLGYFRRLGRLIMHPAFSFLALFFVLTLFFAVSYILILWPQLRLAGATHPPPWPWNMQPLRFRDKWVARRLIVLSVAGIALIVVTYVWWVGQGAP